MNRHFHTILLVSMMIFGTFLSGFIAYGQLSLGFESGLVSNRLITNISNRSFTINQSNAGYWIGIPLQYDLCKDFSVVMDPNFSQKEYSFVRTGPYSGIYEHFINDYFQLPVMAQVQWGQKKLRGMIRGGVYGGYWVSGRVRGSAPNILNVSDSAGAGGSTVETLELSRYHERYLFSAERDERFEFGLAAGIGISYRLKEKITLTFESRVHQSITDQQKKYMINQVPQYNQTFAFLLGCMYSLK